MIPGKSIIVRSGQSIEYILNLIGSSTISPPLPATSSVNLAILAHTSEKSVYCLSGLFSKTAYGLPDYLPNYKLTYGHRREQVVIQGVDV